MKDLEGCSVPAMAVEFDRYLLSASPPRPDFYLYHTTESLEDYMLGQGCFEDMLVERSKRKSRGTSSSPRNITIKNCEFRESPKAESDEDCMLDDWVSDFTAPSEKLFVPSHCRSNDVCVGSSITTEDLPDFVDLALCEDLHDVFLPPPLRTRRLSKSKSESALNRNSDGKNIKKRVSFADESGDRLATYQLIPRGESQYIFDDSCFLLSSFTNRPAAPCSSSSSILRSSFDSATSYTGQPINATEFLPNCNDTVHTICSLGFDQPSSSFSSFLNRLDRDSVCLENARVEDGDVMCTARVKNIAFEKTVYARITYDNWATSEDIPARYVPCGVSAPLYDTFSFQIRSPPEDSLKNRRPWNAEFALCYQANGKVFWDNNKGSNYKVMWMFRQRCSRPA